MSENNIPLEIENSTKFKRDLKKFKNNQDVLNELSEIMDTLSRKLVLAPKYRDHPLMGNWKGHRECHIKPDVLLIYIINEHKLFMERIGSHAELFK